MRVEDVMSRDVVTVAASTPLKEVAELLVEHGVSGLPVVDDEGGVLGVVSEGDIVAKERGVGEPAAHSYYWLFGPDEHDAAKRDARTAAEAMTSPAVTVRPQRAVAEAARLMVERGVNRLPVVVGGKLVGIVTRTDLVRAFIRTDDALEREIRDEVVARTLWLDPQAVQVTATNGEIVLEGVLDTRSDVEILAAYTAQVPGVVSVDDSRLEWRRDDVARRLWHTLNTPVV
jgi:CBS domain-containing protein